MLRSVLVSAMIGALALPAYAQDSDTVETLASEAEVAKVNETLAKIGCKAAEVEKESAQLFEVDDAQCEIGQYDIKLDAEFTVISITKDF